MKVERMVVLALFAGVGLGVVGAELHAQATAQKPVYLVGEVDVKDLEGYTKEYSPKVRATVKAAGGNVIAFGNSGGANNVITLEGAPANRVFIQVWDSAEQMQAWYNSADYKEARKIGDKYATFRQFVVDGVTPPPK